GKEAKTTRPRPRSGEGSIQPPNTPLHGESSCFAFAPRLEPEKKNPWVPPQTASQRPTPADSVIELHSLGLSENPLDLFQHLIRPLQRSRGGKLDVKERVAIILFWQEAGWQPPSDEGVHGREERDNPHTHHPHT